MDKYTLLPITENETDEVVRVARNVFGFGAALMISKKKMWGFYATDGEHIVGAALLDQASETEGFLSWIFVDEAARGHKLASRLIDMGFDAMDKKGLTKQFALVRDDNTASWNMFLKAGYKVLPLHEALFGYSGKGLLKRFNYMMATGYSIWVKDDTHVNRPVYPKHPIERTLAGAAFIGATLALYGFRSFDFLLIAVSTVLAVTIIRMVVAYPIARTYGPVRFMPSRGGFLLSFLIALFTSSWWPTFGFFVPKEERWNDRDFRKNEGLQALATLFALDVVLIVASFAVQEIYAGGLNIVLMIVIIYQLIPVWPLDGFDGAKMLRWNKVAYAIAVILSLLTIFLFI